MTKIPRGVLAAVVVGAVGLAAIAAYPTHGGRASRAPGVEDVSRPRPDDARPCPNLADPAALVILALGQSNAGNHGEGRAASRFGVQWVAGRCYAIADPLAGATGEGGSIWSRLASDLGKAHPGRPLVLVVLAVESTRAAQWAAGTRIGAALDEILHDLQTRGITVSVVLWQQGEADAKAGTTESRYAADLAAVVQHIRAGGVRAPVLLADSTRCGRAATGPVRRGRVRVAQTLSDVHVGPDTDTLDDRLRRDDGCHFTADGLDTAARAWQRALANAGIVGRR